MTRSIPATAILLLIACQLAPTTETVNAGENTPVAAGRPSPAPKPNPQSPDPDTPVSSSDPAPPRRPFTSSADCQIVNHSGWAAHINAMPGPDARPTLIVTGVLGVKPAARTALRLDPAVMESYPPQYIVILDVSHPSEPTIDLLTRREIRGEWLVTPPVGAVHVRCGKRTIATISDIQTAH